MDHRFNKVMYMLCKFKHTLLSGCQKRSMVRFSNVCPRAFKSMKQKVEAN